MTNGSFLPKFGFSMKPFLFCITLAIMLILSYKGYAQNTKITLDIDKVSLEQVLSEIESKTDFKFLVNRTDIDLSQQLSIKARDEKLKTVLERLFAGKGISFEVLDKQIILKKQTPVNPEVVLTKIKGRVTDKDGKPLPGATILIKGTFKGITTNADGEYSITVPDSKTVLVFSYIGFAKQEIIVGNKTIINVSLETAATELEEVTINAGYYTVKEREKTGNISRIASKEIEKQPVSNPLQALQGRMSGVQIQPFSGVPGGGFRIQIRGINSFRQEGNWPLYIIDGVPYPDIPIAQATFGSANGRFNPLASINIADIESIEVLKDADVTAIYGSQAANGVVLITTKKGKIGKTQLYIDTWTGFGQVSNKVDLLNTEQYIEMRNEAFANDGMTPRSRDYDVNGTWDQTRYTDWQEELLGGTAKITSFNANASGGNENTQFFLGGSYYKESTVFPGDLNYQRGSGKLNINHSSNNKKFTANAGVNIIFEKNNLIRKDLTRDALTLPPNAPALYDEFGKPNRENETFNNNPILALQTPYSYNTLNIITNGMLSYKLSEGLAISSTFGYNRLQTDETTKIPISSFSPSRGIDFAQVNLADSYISTWIIEPQINYNKVFGKMKMKVLIGSTFRSTNNENLSISAFGAKNDALITDLKSHSSIRIISSGLTKFKYTAIFTRLNFNWDEKYFVNLTGRRDGSSRFGPGNRFGNFGAIGAAWIFSKENFISDNSIISFGKIRGSYGLTGNDRIQDYGYLSTYGSGQIYQGDVGLVPVRLANPTFGWETNKKLEFGLDLGLFNDNINFSLSWYKNRSDNQLVGRSISAITGFQSFQANLNADIENSGWEFELNTINFSSRNFSWSSYLNLTVPVSIAKVVSFPNIEGSEYRDRTEVGRSLRDIKGFKLIGIDPATGIYVYEDLNNNGDGLDNPEDLQFFGNKNQKYFGGVQNNLSYKGVELNFLFQFVKQKGTTFSTLFNAPGTRMNQPIEVINRWQQPGDETNVQKYTSSNGSIAGVAFSPIGATSRELTDASFIRLKNVHFSYTLPAKFLEKTGIQKMKIYVQGQNLWTITDYKGLDPETQNFAVPPLRILSAGVQLTF